MFSSIKVHEEFKNLNIATTEVGVNGLKLHHKISQNALTALIYEGKNRYSWRPNDDIAPYFFIERENEKTFKVSIRAKFSLYFPCVRCLRDVNLPFDLDFIIRMIRKEQLGKTDYPLEFDCFFTPDDVNDDMNHPVGYFYDERIDLPAILREQIFLSAPDYPTCKDEDIKKATSCTVKKGDSENEIDKEFKPFAKLLSRRA